MAMQAHHADTFRESVNSVLGAPPDPAPLQPEVLDIESVNGFRREHIKYQVSPGDFSYAYLLIPDNLRRAAPTVYVHHRHQNNFGLGKSEVIGRGGDPDQAVGIDLVRRGYIVFAPDAMGFGERRLPTHVDDNASLVNSFRELALRLLRGETLLKKVLWDISRGIDYLETRNEVNPHLIGFMGSDYGGKMALWTAAIEPRIRAAVAHHGVLSFREVLRRGDHLEPELVVPRLMQVAEVHHILSLIAPRAFLVSSTENDIHREDFTEIRNKILPVYDKLGVTNRLSFYHYAEPGFTRHMRYNAYNWLDNWLQFDEAMPEKK
jgi:dienelactone hydrolase